MPRIERIVCAVDFSDCSNHGLAYAIAIARWAHAGVTVLHVLPASSGTAGGETGANTGPMRIWPDRLDEARFDLSGQQPGDVSVNPVVVEGDTVAEIARFAETSGANLLVVGTHGRSGFQRLRLGSVAEHLVRRTPCPLLTVPPRTSDAPRNDPLFEHIICAVDFSPCSLKALDYAASIADLAHARLTILHVFEPVPDCDNQPLRVAAERDLSGLARGPVQAIARVTPVLEVGQPGPKILQFAAKEAADLIVIGVTERTDAQMFFFGSTANHVLRRAPCPVLTLRS